MEGGAAAIKLINGAEITLSNLLALYDDESEVFKIPPDDIAETVKFALELLRKAESSISDLILYIGRR